MSTRAPVRVDPREVGYTKHHERVTRNVIAIVPCYNRPDDAKQVLLDLARTHSGWSGGDVALKVILVDNASSAPLSLQPAPPGLDVEHLRLASNTGGSGGFNAGIARALERFGSKEDGSTYLWLVDSDARVDEDTLAGLIGVLERSPDVVAAGAAIGDPSTGQVFELGGNVNRRNGCYEPCVPGAVGIREPVECDYVAACCALVRAAAARATGLMPDRFLNGDDVEWFIRMRQRTRGRVVAVPWARALHPRFDRFPTWTRYYTTRNALGAAWALELGFTCRLRRTMCDAWRAVQHTLVGRHDLAQLHLAGLADLARGAVTGAGAANIRVETPRAIDELEPRLRALLREPGPERRNTAVELLSVLARLVVGPPREVAAIPARPGLRHIALARTQLLCDGAGAVLRESRGLRDVLSGAAVLAQGSLLALRAALRRGDGPSMPDVEFLGHAAQARLQQRTCSLDIVVLSYNRRQSLLKTLASLHEDPFVAERLKSADVAITVADNASSDGSVDAVRSAFPDVRVISFGENLGIEAFNRAIAQCERELVLVLDDDATPAPGAIAVAVDALARDPDLAAVTLLPRHPSTGESEWPFGDDPCAPPSNHWPVMGCANLVRRSAWHMVGGYEASYFLYRNDTDLALKLLGRGMGVRCDPALVAWHDTAAGPGAPKSERWHQLATRNWVWTARRHGRGLSALLGLGMGCLWAHKAAGVDLARQRATFAGLVDGVRTPAPEWTPDAGRRGAAWLTYLRLRLNMRVR